MKTLFKTNESSIFTKLFFVFLTVTILSSFVFAETSKQSSFIDSFEKAIQSKKVADAVQLADEELKKSAKDYDVVWRASRAYLFFADEQSDKKQQEKLYLRSKELAESAIQLRPDQMQGYIRRAAAAGKVALFKGILETRELILQVKADCEKAIALNNSDTKSLALAHYILGRAHLKLSDTPKVVRKPMGLAWGTVEDSIRLLSESAKLNDASIATRLELAKANLKAEKKNEAKEQLNIAIKLAPTEIGDEARITEAKDLLAKSLN